MTPSSPVPSDRAAPDTDGAPAQAFREAIGHFAELKEYVRYYIDAKLDSYKVTARNVAIYAVLGLIGAMAGVAVAMTAVVLLLYGIADGIGRFCVWAFGPAWWWIGPVAVGVLILGGAALGVIIGMKWLTRTTHRKLVAKYEDRQRRQRASFGHDVEERAAEQRERAGR